jgi:hypothetical protein
VIALDLNWWLLSDATARCVRNVKNTDDFITRLRESWKIRKNRTSRRGPSSDPLGWARTRRPHAWVSGRFGVAIFYRLHVQDIVERTIRTWCA